MSLVYGHANPRLQRALLELCFSDQSADPDFRSVRLAQVDEALQRDTLSGEQLRTLPLLYRLVPTKQMSLDSQSKIVGIYKHTLYRNHLMLNRLAQVQDRFRQAGFEAMIGLKGLPAISYLGQGIGARPMADVDVLIPRMHLRPREALQLLESMGYRVKGSGFRFLALISNPSCHGGGHSRALCQRRDMHHRCSRRFAWFRHH